MRILLVTHGLPPESVGGVEQHVAGLARALAGAGHDVAIWTRTGRPGLPQGTLVDEDTPSGPITRVVYRYEGLRELRDLYAVPLLDDALRGFLAARPRFDVAHVHHLTGISTGILDVLADARVPVVLTLHDYWLLCPRGQMWDRAGAVSVLLDPAHCADCLQPTFPSWLPPGGGPAVLAELHAGARRLLERPARLVVPSAAARAPFTALGIAPERLHVVENAVDVGALAALPDPVRGDGPLRLGYFGTLLPSKGLDVLVAAIHRLPPDLVSLAIHGNAAPYHGDEGFLTRVFAQVTPADRITYHGPYTAGALPERMRDVDAVVVPALWAETFGLTAREALAAGRPVVASRIGGLAEACTDGGEGILVPPGDVPALAAAIARLATDRTLFARLAGAGRGRARAFPAMAAELVALYRELLPAAAGR